MNRGSHASRPLLALLAGVLALVSPGCRTLPDEPPRAASAAWVQPADSPLGRSFAPWMQGPSSRAGVHLLPHGDESFGLRAASAEQAQHTLDLQYYIVADDAAATLLLARALRAADRGVRVRLLVDDVGTADADHLLESLDAHALIEVRLYNPFSQRRAGWFARALEYLGHSDRLGQRMHHKLWVVDNALAIVGGRNLGDAYFAFDRERQFADLDALVVGPLVRQLSQGFDGYWNSDAARSLRRDRSPEAEAQGLSRARSVLQQRERQFRESAYAQSLRAAGLGSALHEGRIDLVAARGTVVDGRPPLPEPVAAAGAGDPANAGVGGPAARVVADATGAAGEGGVAPQPGPLIELLRSVVAVTRRELLLVSPYFVPGDRGVEAICALQARGVRVRVLTNSLASTDVPVVHAGYARKRPALLACGVELFELKPGPKGERRGLSSGASLHAKAVVADRQVAILGSMNLDPRSRRVNTEIALRLDSAELGAQLGALFDEAVRPESVYRPVLEAGGDEPRLHWLSTDDGQAVRRAYEPEASLWRHLTSDLLGILAPEEML